MNGKAQSRINEIDAQTVVLVKRSEVLHLDQTERAQIAIDLRRLLAERENIVNKNNPTFQTTTGKTLFRIVQRWLK